MGAHPFRAAVEAQDLDGMIEALDPDVVFHSPVTFKPFEGREATAQVLRAVFEVFEDFRYTDELEADATLALVFRARVGDRQVEGVDLLRLNPEGRIEDFTVLVRPLSAVTALGEAMRAKLAGAS